MNENDRIRVTHMLEMAHEAVNFAHGENRESLDDDRKLVFAIVRAVEIIGEAASKVSPECKNEHSLIPWQAIIGMRNRLVHAYMDVSLDLVWDTVIDDLPRLIEQLEQIISPDEG